MTDTKLRSTRAALSAVALLALTAMDVGAEDRSALGAFAWKPVYRIVPEPGEEAVRILPGHLGIFEPRSLRLPLLYRLLGLAYRTRNRSIKRRRSAMLRAVLLALRGRFRFHGEARGSFYLVHVTQRLRGGCARPFSPRPDAGAPSR